MSKRAKEPMHYLLSVVGPDAVLTVKVATHHAGARSTPWPLDAPQERVLTLAIPFGLDHNLPPPAAIDLGIAPHRRVHGDVEVAVIALAPIHRDLRVVDTVEVEERCALQACRHVE